MKNKSEHDIQNEIMLAVSQNACSIIRINVGKFKLPDGRWFTTGAPKGHPDLYGFRWSDTKIFYIEVKAKNGKPSDDQVRFHNFLQSHKVIHGIARSSEDAIKIIKGGLVGYGY